jgi:hypothetical protein
MAEIPHEARVEGPKQDDDAPLLPPAGFVECVVE